MRIHGWSKVALVVLGVMVSGTAWAQQPPAPIEELVTRCHAGDARICAIAGARYHTGTHGAPRDPAIALDLYTRACDANLAVGCGLMAGIYLDGIGVAADVPRAVALYQRACTGGYDHACGQLGILYAAGRGVPRDFAEAAPRLERGCTANHWAACGVLGRMHRAGLGVARNEPRGTELLQRSCAGGFAAACRALTEAPPTAATGVGYASPPPVAGEVNFSAPPPVVSAGTFAAPPPVAVAVAPAAPVRVAPPPRVYVRRPAPVADDSVEEAPAVPYRARYRPGLTTPPQSPSTVAFFGVDIPVPLVTFSYELAVGANAPQFTSYGLGMLFSRGPIEFGASVRYGGGQPLPTDNGPASEWTGLLFGGQLGLNLLSAPRADRNSFSPINLTVGLNGSYALADLGDSPAGRVGAYAANTLFLSCSLVVRAEYTRTFSGEDTFGHTLSVALGYARRPDSSCR